jgi:ABC-2 type transport system ATP-binding protein
MIEVKSLVKNFGAVRALDQVSFTVKNGAAFGLLGRNGAGKTTTIRIIMDIFKPDSGEVLIDGVRPAKGNFSIGYLPEERGLYPKRTILEQMIYIGKLRGMTKIAAHEDAMRMLNRLEAEEYVDRKLETLSKGNQQKIQLAIALMDDPDIIILDEPFSGLDPVNARILKDAIRAEVDKKKTVIFSSHQMSQVEEFCDDICLMNQGQVALAGELDAIKKSYPRNVVEIEIDGADTKSLEEKLIKLTSGSGINFTSNNSVLTATLPNPEMRGDLLNVLQRAGAQISRFAVKEPSLEEIFIDKVGGSIEDLHEDAGDLDPPVKSKKRGLFGGRK